MTEDFGWTGPPMRQRSELEVEPGAIYRHRAAIAVEGGVVEPLSLERNASDGSDPDRVVRVHDTLGLVVEPAVAEHETHASGG